jgi:glucose-6-phosphate isomerase
MLAAVPLRGPLDRGSRRILGEPGARAGGRSIGVFCTTGESAMIEVAGLRFDISGAEEFLPAADLDALAPRVTEIAAELEAGSGPGSDYLGWLDLPADVTDDDFAALEMSAQRARADSEVYVVIGIGGSYLGARAVLEALGPDGGAPWVKFAGTSLGSGAMARLLASIADKELRLCVISKSGTTLEPALAFRMLRAVMLDRYGREETARRITVVTDAQKGALRQMAAAEQYESFTIPDDVGGRFSVLTPVGLLPLAVAGVDIRRLVAGAAAMRRACRGDDLNTNPAHLYAACRHALYKRGYTIEILSTFSAGLQLVQEWWKQLFGESEGKGGHGTFPASAVFTTDLHSLGQYIQDGRRQLLETFLTVTEEVPQLTVPAAGPDAAAGLDGLDYLVGRPLDEINHKAFAGTRRAHIAGGVPCLGIELARLDAPTLGGLIYLFEKAVAVSGRLLGVNPFDQPGVETYKREMFDLLGRP